MIIPPAFFSVNTNRTYSMIAIAVYALIIFHPGFGFQNKFNEIKYEAVHGAESGKEEVFLNGAEDAPYLRQ